MFDKNKLLLYISYIVITDGSQLLGTVYNLRRILTLNNLEFHRNFTMELGKDWPILQKNTINFVRNIYEILYNYSFHEPFFSKIYQDTNKMIVAHWYGFWKQWTFGKSCKFGFIKIALDSKLDGK